MADKSKVSRFALDQLIVMAGSIRRKLWSRHVFPGFFAATVLGLQIPLQSPPVMAATNTKPALEEVIVTARKREENMQHTPVSITALSGADIERNKLFNMRDLEARTPNLATPAAGDGSSGSFQAFLRGVGQFDWALTTDPGVGVYVDGVYLARTIASNLEFSDIASISILRGPQGTLFGKNTIGGAIDVVTIKPSGDRKLKAKYTEGTFDYKAFDAYIEFPVTEHIAASVSVLSKKSDGWQTRDSGDNAGNDNMWGMRSHLGLDFTDVWGAHLVVDHTEVDQNVYPRVLVDFNPDAAIPPLYNLVVKKPLLDEPCCEENKDIDHSSVLNEKDRDVSTSSGFTLNNIWDISEVSLKSITGYRVMDSEVYRDSDNSRDDYFSVEGIFDTSALSQEFLLSNNSSGDFIDWIVGLYYMKEDGNHKTDVVVAGGLYDNGLLVPTFDFTLYYDRTQVTTSYASYFNVNIHVAESTRINLAGRYTFDKKDLHMYMLRRASQSPIAEPGPTGPEACSDVVVDGNGSSYRCSNEWTDFSPRVGIDHDFGEQFMVYAHVAKGFRSGIYNGRPIETKHISMADPEFLTSYEIGFKSRFWEQRLQLNGAVFYNDYEDQQFLVSKSSQSATGSLALVVDNAANSTMRGAELEFTLVPSQNFTVSGGVGWLDPEYQDFMAVDPATGEDVDLSDREFAQVPDWTANLMVSYVLELQAGSQLQFRADTAYKSDVYHTNDRGSVAYEVMHTGGHSMHNAGVTFVSPEQRWEFSVFGKNLGDKRIINGGFEVGAFGITDVSYTPPRRVFASIRYNGDF